MKRPAAGHLAHFFHVQFLLVTHAYVPPSAMRVYSKNRSCAILPCTVQSRSLTAPSGMAPSASVANGLLRVKFSATFLWFVGIGMLPWPLSLIVSLLACLPSSCSFCICFTSVYTNEAACWQYVYTKRSRFFPHASFWFARIHHCFLAIGFIRFTRYDSFSSASKQPRTPSFIYCRTAGRSCRLRRQGRWSWQRPWRRQTTDPGSFPVSGCENSPERELS